MSKQARIRPAWLPYKARDGVYETHFVRHATDFTDVFVELLQ